MPGDPSEAKNEEEATKRPETTWCGTKAKSTPQKGGDGAQQTKPKKSENQTSG